MAPETNFIMNTMDDSIAADTRVSQY